MMFAGVSKSGSPTVRPMTLRPASCSSRTRIVAIELGDGLMRFIRGAIKLIADVLCRRRVQRAAPDEFQKGLMLHQSGRDSFVRDHAGGTARPAEAGTCGVRVIISQEKLLATASKKSSTRWCI